MSLVELKARLERCGLSFSHIPAGAYAVGAEHSRDLLALPAYEHEYAFPSVTPPTTVAVTDLYISTQVVRLSHWQKLCEEFEELNLAQYLTAEQLQEIENGRVSDPQVLVYPSFGEQQFHNNLASSTGPLEPRLISQQLELDPAVTVEKEVAAQITAALGVALPQWHEWEIAARGQEQYLYPWGNELDVKQLALDKQDYSVDTESVMGYYSYDQDVVFVYDFGEYARHLSPFGLADLARIGREWNTADAQGILTTDPFLLRSLSDLGTMATMVPGIRYNTWRQRNWDYLRAFSGPALPCYALSTVGENPAYGYDTLLYHTAAWRLVLHAN